MDQHVDRGRDPDHPPHQNEALPLQDRFQRRDRQRDEEEAHDPEPDLVDRLGERPRLEKPAREAEHDPCAGHEQPDKHGELQRRQAPAVIVPGVFHETNPVIARQRSSLGRNTLQIEIAASLRSSQ
jgi:hypothetical protein